MLLIFAFMLSSCTSINDRRPEADEIKINLIADMDINPNESGEPAPLNIFIYSVKARDAFSNADFFEIVDGSSKSVQTFASKIYEAILQPGESRSVFIKPDENTRTLGVIGAYRNLNDSGWLVTWDLPEKNRMRWRIFGGSSVISAHFQKTAITIKKMD